MGAPPPAPRSRLCGAWGPFPRVFAAGAVAADSPGFVEDREQRSVNNRDSQRKLTISTGQQFQQASLAGHMEEYLLLFMLKNATLNRAKRRFIITDLMLCFSPACTTSLESVRQLGQCHSSSGGTQQSAHRAATRGFIRYGWRWSWRTAVFVTIFNTVNTGLTVYRNKDAMSHFAIAGAVTGGLFRINLGVRGLVAGSIIGALLGAPMGSLLMALEKYSGETVQERRQKEWKALHEQRLEEWRSSLQVTELLPMEIESGLEKIQPEGDAQRIEELLSLPRNPSSPHQQSKH